MNSDGSSDVSSEAEVAPRRVPMQAQAAHFRASLIGGDRRSALAAWRSSPPMRRANRIGRQAVRRAIRPESGDKRGVTNRSRTFHDSPRNQLNSRSIGDGEAHSSRQREYSARGL